MNNKKSIVWVCVIAVVLVLLSAMSFAPRFQVSETDDFISPLNLIQYGSDFKQDIAPDYTTGEYVVYNMNEYLTDVSGNYVSSTGNIVTEDKKVKIDSAIMKDNVVQTAETMKKRLDLITKNQTEVTVLDNNKIRVEIDDKTSASTIFDLLSARGVIELKLVADKPDDKTDMTKFENVLDEGDYEYMQLSYDNSSSSTTYALLMTFKDNTAKNKYIEATKAVKNDSDKTMYLCMVCDGKLVGSPLSVTTTFSASQAYFYVSGLSQSVATETAIYMQSGSYKAAVVKENLQIKAVGPKLGNQAGRTLFYTIIAAMLVAVIVMLIRYGMNGLAALLSLDCFAILSVFMIAFIPVVPFNFESLLGVVIGVIINIICQAVILSSISKEYSTTNKNRKDCIKDGYKKGAFVALDVIIVAIIVAIMFAVAIPGVIRGFAMCVIFTLIASAISILLTLGFIKLVNGMSSNDNIYGMKRITTKEVK